MDQSNDPTRDALRRALHIEPQVEEVVEEVKESEEEVKVVKKRKPKLKPKKKDETKEPLSPEVKRSGIQDGVFEFFQYNQWTTTQQNKDKLTDIRDFLINNTKVDGRGKAITHLSKMNFKMGDGIPGLSLIDKFHKYIKIKASVKDLSEELKAYE